MIVQAGAAVLCMVLAAPAGTAHGAGSGGPGPGPAGPGGVAEVSGTVDRLFRDAAEATERYQAARRASAAQRRKVADLRRAVRQQHRRLVVLRGRIGQMAARQYQSGGLGPTAELVLATRPEEMLDKARLLDKGEQAAAGLYRRADAAEQRLESEKERQAAGLAGLRRELRAQARAKRRIEAKLGRALRRLDRFRAAAGAGCSGGGRPWAMTPSADGKAPAGGRWTAPVATSAITSRFDQSGELWTSRHTGLDFAVPEGRPVGSVGYGVVYDTGCDAAFGNSVTVLHDDGYYTFYAHLSEIGAVPGERVYPGRPIGRAGSTGNSTGPHLHFEVRVTPQFGSGIDPEPWLRGKGVRLTSGG